LEEELEEILEEELEEILEEECEILEILEELVEILVEELAALAQFGLSFMAPTNPKLGVKRSSVENTFMSYRYIL
jgi:hypothetical protein